MFVLQQKIFIALDHKKPQDRCLTDSKPDVMVQLMRPMIHRSRPGQSYASQIGKLVSG